MSTARRGSALVVAVATVLALFGVWHGREVQGQEGCDAYCFEQLTCSSTDIDCLACDPPGSGACSDVTFYDYNPGGVYIEYCAIDEAASLVCREQDEVICYTFQSCGTGSALYFQYCSGGGAGCTGVPMPAWCHLCVKTGSPTNVTVTDWHCVAE